MGLGYAAWAEQHRLCPGLAVGAAETDATDGGESRVSGSSGKPPISLDVRREFGFLGICFELTLFSQ